MLQRPDRPLLSLCRPHVRRSSLKRRSLHFPEHVLQCPAPAPRGLCGCRHRGGFRYNRRTDTSHRQRFRSHGLSSTGHCDCLASTSRCRQRYTPLGPLSNPPTHLPTIPRRLTTLWPEPPHRKPSRSGHAHHNQDSSTPLLSPHLLSLLCPGRKLGLSILLRLHLPSLRTLKRSRHTTQLACVIVQDCSACLQCFTIPDRRCRGSAAIVADERCFGSRWCGKRERVDLTGLDEFQWWRVFDAIETGEFVEMLGFAAIGESAKGEEDGGVVG